MTSIFGCIRFVFSLHDASCSHNDHFYSFRCTLPRRLSSAKFIDIDGVHSWMRITRTECTFRCFSVASNNVNCSLQQKYLCHFAKRKAIVLQGILITFWGTRCEELLVIHSSLTSTFLNELENIGNFRVKWVNARESGINIIDEIFIKGFKTYIKNVSGVEPFPSQVINRESSFVHLHSFVRVFLIFVSLSFIIFIEQNRMSKEWKRLWLQWKMLDDRE